MALVYTFCTEAEADAFFLGRLGSDSYWTSGAEKEAALTTAYRQIYYNKEYEFTDPASGVEWATVIKYAQCEQALFLLIHQEDMDKRVGLQAQGVRTAWSVQEGYAEGVKRPPICISAKEYLKPYRKYGMGLMVNMPD